MARAVAILGMHRSGTSAVARAFNLLGVDLGGIDRLMPANDFNQEGYWEHIGIYQVHERILDALGVSWDSGEPLPDGWEARPEVQPLKEEIRAIVQRDFAGKELWGWKEPRTCLVLPIWKPILRDLGVELQCLIATRNPVDVAASLERRNGFHRPESIAMWLNYTLGAIEVSLDLRSAVVDYDDLVDDWRAALERPAKALDLPLPQDETTKAELSEFLKPALRHSRSRPEDLRADKPLEALAADTYQFLKRRAAGMGDDEYRVEGGTLIRRFREIAEAFRSTSTFETKLFWPVDGKYGDHATKEFRGFYGPGDNVFEWTVTSLEGKELRLDPSDASCRAVLKRVEVLTQSGASLRLWSPATGWDGVRPDRNIQPTTTDEGLSLLCHTSDPHLFLPIDTSWQPPVRVRVVSQADRVPPSIAHELASLAIRFDGARAQLQEERKRLRAAEQSIQSLQKRLAKTSVIEDELADLKPKYERANLHLQASVEHNERLREQVHALSSHVHSIESSRIWRITRPLVRFLDGLKGKRS